MSGDKLRDLNAFLAVAEEASFTRAATRLGLSQSALSQTIRGLEERLGIRLFARTTRSVSLTEAGERLLVRIGPAMREIDAGMAEVGELRAKPSGTIRLTADEFAVHHVLWPAIERFLPRYPDVRVEVTTDYGMTDIVSDRFDAGVRRGGLVAKDMIAARISADIRMAVVGAPSYFARHARPKHPRDLASHGCLNLRLPAQGFFTWSFRKGSREQRIKVEGPLVFNSLMSILPATRAGFGLAYLPEAMVQKDVERGRLTRVLDDWSRTYEGYHLYYPNRRHASSAFALLVEALRYRD